MSLFQWGNFTLHSGDKTWWRIDCDDLTESEIAIFAKMIREKAGEYHRALCPDSHKGSAAPRLTSALHEHRAASSGRGYKTLIVDDVLTTGASMNEVRQLAAASQLKGSEIEGYVIFARGTCPAWITPIFQFSMED